MKDIISHIKHYLPAQSPLKDFVHHNTLHAFQHKNFHEGLFEAANTFGYQLYLTLKEYRAAYQAGKINEKILERCISESKGQENLALWKSKLLETAIDETQHQKVGDLRQLWKLHYQVNFDKYTHPLLFRTVGGFLDQGIAMQSFPYEELSFLESLRAMEKNSFSSWFKTRRARRLLLEANEDAWQLLEKLLQIVVGDASLFEHYLFDQQFAHPGWSGMVTVLEATPNALLDRRKVALVEFICFELLLEIDVLDKKFGENWQPLATVVPADFVKDIFAANAFCTDLAEADKARELYEVYRLWQESFEWSYYDEVLKGLQLATPAAPKKASFQAVFCIDDREGSLRRYLEKNAPACETFSTAGFFNMPIYFQPEHGKFLTKSCPGPAIGTHLIQEHESQKRHKKELHFNKVTDSFFGGWLATPTLGFWSAIQLGWSILFPRPSASMVSSFKHMDKDGFLSIESTGETQDELKVGFTTAEMVERVQGLLKGIGLIDNFAALVYFVGHGASSSNNTHYAGYDCGACSGRAGSVNARIAAYMANKPEVRQGLKEKGIIIPEETQFLGGLHDTTRDEIAFFDEHIVSKANQASHTQNKITFDTSLDENAKERSRRFVYTDSNQTAKAVHEKVKERSLCLFEPRPEWNHATNSLCIIGERASNKHLFLDRRAFFNSYNYRIDESGAILLGILNAVAPVCGGINLEYYFSRVDNYRLGAGSKLPHNVMGLIGVANGMDGDLRPGLPMQMVNIHDPLRLLVTIEHFPQEVLRIMQINPATYKWFLKSWIHLAVIHPETKALFLFKNGEFVDYQPLAAEIKKLEDMGKLVESTAENLAVYQIV